MDEAIFYKLDGEIFTIIAAPTDNFTVVTNSTEGANYLIPMTPGDQMVYIMMHT